MARFPIYHHQTGTIIGTAEIPDDIIYAAGKVEAWIRAHEYENTEIVLNGLVIKKGWQPIKTAPEDGTRILLYVSLRSVLEDEFSPKEIVVGYFDTNEFCKEWRIVERTPEETYLGEPTHWMPLPEPPK